MSDTLRMPQQARQRLASYRPALLAASQRCRQGYQKYQSTTTPSTIRYQPKGVKLCRDT
jgi:hypothetical protein